MRKTLATIMVVGSIALVALRIDLDRRFSRVPRVERDIRTLSAALADYHHDNGHYPSDPASSARLKTNSDFDPADYRASAEFLYRALSRGADGNPATPPGPKPKPYYQPPGSPMLRSDAVGKNPYFVDLWGNPYGYSTFKAENPASPEGHNPTYDLWSTGGQKSAADVRKWIKNW